MKEEWLFPNAVVPVDVETTAALVVEIHRLIDVVGGMVLAQPAPVQGPYSAPIKELWPVAPKPWVGLTDKEFEEIIMSAPNATVPVVLWQLIQDKLKEKNT
jgi:hypothetical protein